MMRAKIDLDKCSEFERAHASNNDGMVDLIASVFGDCWEMPIGGGWNVTIRDDIVEYIVDPEVTPDLVIDNLINETNMYLDLAEEALKGKQ